MAPAASDDDDAETVRDAAFAALLEAAGGAPIFLAHRTVVLEAPVRCSATRPVHVVGPGSVVGSGHSVFQVGGKQRSLTLDGVSVRHVPSPARAAKRAAGAAVFVQGAGAAALRRCAVASAAGFGVWLRQRGRATLVDCDVEAGRTAVAVFNDARVNVVGGAVRGDPHGVCARGRARVAARGTRLEGCGVRAVYGYMSARVALADVVVAGTRDATQAAVQVEALRPGDAAALDLDGVRFRGNAGRDLSVAGAVALTGAAAYDVGDAPASGPNAFGVGRPRNPLM